MTVRSWTRSVKDVLGRDVIVSSESMNSGNSSRVNGKLVLRANVANHFKGRTMSWWVSPLGPANDRRAWSPHDANSLSLPPGFSYTALDNEAYAKFQGKLRKGSASMGVTLASWKQSRDMITSRFNHARRTLDSSIAHLERNPGALKRLKREREPLAGQILEYEFGWAPLVQDVRAALFTVVKDGVPPEWITSRARGSIFSSQVIGSDPVKRQSWDGRCWVTYSAKAEITNPNLWLLNRMGLINPATVAWDLIPWSFVVNWFVNAGQMVSSITDEVGISLSNQSITRCSHSGFEELKYSPNSTTIGPAFARVNQKYRVRTVGSSLQPKWQVKVPELNWELAVIATSLVVQRVKKINQLIRLI